jgi:TRAP-type C4-dicarboxylate transport system substrate-binding protein
MSVVRRIIVAACASAIIAIAPASAQTKWNFPTAYPADNPHTENIMLFAKDVADATGGQLQITVHPNASLVRAPDIKRAVQTGRVQIGSVLMSLHENEFPVYGVDVIPFLATSYPEARKLWEASRPAIAKQLASEGMLLLFAVPWGPQGIYAKKDINSVADMKGLKWRAYNLGTARIGELVGAEAVIVQAAELPPAMSAGVINAFITSAATGYDAQAWDSMDHFYDTQAWIPKNMTFVNKAAFDALDTPTQEAVLKAAAAAEPRGWKLWQDKNGWYLDQLKSHGMKVMPPGAELLAGFKKIGGQLMTEWLAKAGKDGEEVIAAYKK